MGLHVKKRKRKKSGGEGGEGVSKKEGGDQFSPAFEVRTPHTFAFASLSSHCTIEMDEWREGLAGRKGKRGGHGGDRSACLSFLRVVTCCVCKGRWRSTLERRSKKACGGGRRKVKEQIANEKDKKWMADRLGLKRLEKKRVSGAVIHAAEMASYVPCSA